MIELVTRELVGAYLSDDAIGAFLDTQSRVEDELLTCQRWLRDTPAKRFIYARLYGDLLVDNRRRRVLDVGGGLMSPTRALALRHDYTLVDLVAHDTIEAVERFLHEVHRSFLIQVDWFSFAAEGCYDVVVANDLFPNVDQRLELFLDKFLPCARAVRMTLTYYNTPRFYLTRRINADEVLCMLAWNGRLTRVTMEKYAERIAAPGLSVLDQEAASVYPNGRQVCLVELRGDAPVV